MLERVPGNSEARLCDIIRRIDRAYDVYARSKGLTYMGLLVLEFICSHRGICTQRMICDELYYPKQNVNQIVGSFLDSGYVALMEIPEDRRSKAITLTEEGERFAEEVLGPLWSIDDGFAESHRKKMEEFLDTASMYADAFESSVRRQMSR